MRLREPRPTSIDADAHGRRRGVAVATAVAVAAAACSSNQATSPSSQSTMPAAVRPAATFTPDLSNFLRPGSNTICANGGTRPCAIAIRAQPQRASKVINQAPGQVHLTWPLESYNGQPGDGVSVLCYANGRQVTAYEGGSSSTFWYKVLVPESQAQNPDFLAGSQSKPTIPTVTDASGEPNIIGWTAIVWFGQTTPAPQVPPC